MKELIEGYHYYVNEDGFVVLTKEYHLEQGYCCGKGCLHCPFEYENVPEPRRGLLKLQRLKDQQPPQPGEADK